MEFKEFKKADIWAEIKFVPADKSRGIVTESTKKFPKTETKFQKIIHHLKEIWRLLK